MCNIGLTDEKQLLKETASVKDLFLEVKRDINDLKLSFRLAILRKAYQGTILKSKKKAQNFITFQQLKSATIDSRSCSLVNEDSFYDLFEKLRAEQLIPLGNKAFS